MILQQIPGHKKQIYRVSQEAMLTKMLEIKAPASGFEKDI